VTGHGPTGNIVEPVGGNGELAASPVDRQRWGRGGARVAARAADTSTAYAIEQWATSTFSAQTIGGSTVYDLSQ